MESTRRSRRRPRAALSLIEALIAVAVVEVAVFAVSFALNAGSVQVQESDTTVRAVAAAERLVETILALPYADPDGPSAPGPEPGETDPARFDNTDDYHGFTDVNAGDSLARSVAVAYVDEYVADLNDSIPGLTVTVTVTVVEDGRVWEFTRFLAEPTS